MARSTAARLTGVLLLTALTAMIAGAVIVVPSGLPLNPAEPAAALAAVEARLGLHLVELGLDVLGWLALTGAALTMAARTTAGLRRAGLVAALSGLAAVVLPWTTGSSSPSATLEQLGYALHLPIMICYGVLGWRELRARPRVVARPD